MLSRFGFLIISAALLASCSFAGSITDLTGRGTAIRYGQLMGTVSGAQVQSSAGGMSIVATVGEDYGAISSTSSTGMTLYSNVSGNMTTQSATSFNY